MTVSASANILLYIVHPTNACSGGDDFAKVDNTVKESKNNTIMKLMAWLLLQKGLELTGLLMSRVGHTHSTLGALLSID